MLNTESIKSMKSSKSKIKTITFSLPVDMGKDMQKIAKEENRTISELIRESFRQYQAQRNFTALVKKGKATAGPSRLIQA